MTLVMFLILLLGFSVTMIRMILPYLLAVTMGGIFAILFQSSYNRLTRLNLHPKVTSLVVTLAIFFLVIGPISLFITLAVRQGLTIGQTLANSNDLSLRSLTDRIAHWRVVEPFVEDPVAFENQIKNLIQDLGKNFTALVPGLVAIVPKIILQLVLAAISCFFFFIDGRDFINWTMDKIPIDSQISARLLDSFQNTAVSVIWATLAAAAAQAFIMFFSFLALGVPSAFLAAGAIFIFAWIPMIGSTPVWITGALYLYLQGRIIQCFAMIGLGMLTGVVDNFVRPLVLKGRGGMHPLVSLISIFGGIQMFGIFGVFLGPMIAAAMITLLQIWPVIAKKFGLIN